MARKIEVEIVGDAHSFNNALNSATSSGSRFGRGITKVAKVAAIGFAAVGVAAAIGAKKSIDAASDLNESMNAVSVVFGKASQKIFEFGKTAAEAAGLSQRAFNEAVTPIGAQLRNVGLSADEAAEQAIHLTQVAADMASVFNVDVSEALTAIQAGLRGEADPIERFGVSLQQASIEAYAVRTGLMKAGDEMTNQMKVQARLGLLYEQTNRVAGDFANTSDGLANQTRILKAEFENMEAEIGTALLPVATAFMGVLLDLIPIVKRVGGVIVDSLGRAFEFVHDLLFTSNKTWDHYGNQVKHTVFRFQAQLNRIKEVAGVVFSAVKEFIVGTVIPAFGRLRNWVTNVVKDVAKVFEKHRPELTKIWEDVQGVVKDVAAIFRDQIGPLLRKVVPAAIDKAIPVIATLADALVTVTGWANSAASGIERLINAIHSLPGGGGGGLMGHLSGIPGGNEGLLDLIKGDGGPVSAGRPYIVGDRGPELFVPRGSGGIVPNHALGGGGGSVNVIVLGGDREAINYLRQLDYRSSRRSGRGVF